MVPLQVPFFNACLFLFLSDLKMAYSTYNFVFLIIICLLNFYSLHSNFLKSFHFHLVKIILCLTNMFSLRCPFLPPNQIFFKINLPKFKRSKEIKRKVMDSTSENFIMLFKLHKRKNSKQQIKGWTIEAQWQAKGYLYYKTHTYWEKNISRP